MYADRYGGRVRLDPGALALALGGSALFLFGLTLTAPNFVTVPETILKLVKVAPDPVPPPPHEKLAPQPKAKLVPSPSHPDRVEITKPPVDPSAGAQSAGTVDVQPDAGTTVGTGDGAGVFPPPPLHVPVLTVPQLDARYAGAFQPDYPLGERQAEHEGRVVVRVLIGVDGRVKAVEQVSAPSAAFFEATRKRALDKWRFRPGTRDGIPVEAWREIGVVFRLETE